PENILIRNYDGKTVLIDFGAVKETMGTVMTASGNFSTSIVIGTPGFMPSEQTAGRPVFSSDLYSLGLTAIYLLTGKIPQQLASDPATGEILWRHHALSISPSFVSILDRAIASYPRDRYSSAKEMLQALQMGVPPIAPIIQPSNPISVSTPPPVPYAQPPKVVSATPAGFSSQQPVYSGRSPQNHGMNDWQKAVIIGGVIGVCVVAGLWLREQLPNPPQPSPSPTVVNVPTPSPTPSEPTRTISNIQPQSPSPSPVQPTFSPEPSPDIPSNTNTSSITTPFQPELTTTDAENLIYKWLQAKRVMFGRNYDPQPASELTVDPLYEGTAGANGSINSLKRDGEYYEYPLQRIDSVDYFDVNGSEATIQLKVTEDRKLYKRNGDINPNETDFKTRTVIYKLKFDDDRWKIASFEIIKD
ncbi:IMS domain-containing protein, partial [Nostoc sp. CALU 546]